MMDTKRVVCSMCDLSCTLEAHIKDGQLERLAGFKDHPINPNVFCNKAARAKEWFYNGRRLLHPLKRKGDRGSGQWERISWDQAMDEIAERLQKIVLEHGPESFACSSSEYNCQVGSGAARRFMNLLGSPNYISGVSLCFGNTAAVNSMTYGAYPFSDFEQTRCIVYFGHNPKPNVWAGEYQRLKAALRRGAKFIVMDPRRSHCAKLADIHLPLRPGTDAAMALGWLHVIIDEGLYDKEFVAKWCEGFGDLKKRVGEYPLDRIEKITGVRAGLIREAARMYAATKPAIIPWTVITDQQRNSTSALRCQSILRALTGNLNVPGGDVLLPLNPAIISESEIELHEALPLEKQDLQLGADDYPLMTYKGQRALNEHRQRVWGRPCMNLLKGQYMAHPPAVFKAMREGVPYPVKAFFAIANNTLMCYTNQRGIYEALNKLDLLVANDIFMTPTAELADYVLPGDAFLERPVLINAQEWINSYFIAPKAIEPPGECKDVYHFWRELAVRMGMEESFPWKTLEELYDYRVQGTGLTWEQISSNFFSWPSPPAKLAPTMARGMKVLARLGLLSKAESMALARIRRRRALWEAFERRNMPGPQRLFRDDVMLVPYPHEKLGFATPSGKVELSSTMMEDLGLDPLPYWADIGLPGEADDRAMDDYPLQLCVGLREEEYFHSAGRHVEKMRKSRPEPLAILHSGVAAGLGIEDGDWVYVETSWGKVEMKASLSDETHPDLVIVPHGWWKPETGNDNGEFYGIWKYSDGVLLDDDPAHFDPEQGLPDLRGARRCKVTLLKRQ